MTKITNKLWGYYLHMKAEEYSERALHITELGINELASHYTIWIYRFNILKNLPNRNLYDELDWCEEIALDNEKTIRFGIIDN